MEAIPLLSLLDTILNTFGYCGSKGQRTKDEILTHIFNLDNFQVDYVPCNVKPSSGNAKLVIFEDNEAVIKMTIKGRSPQIRHVSRTHRIDLDFLFERIREDPGIQIMFVGTKDQIADMLTKGAFSAEA